MGDIIMGSPGRKIFLDSKKYIYGYQFKFLKNMIKKDKKMSYSLMKEYLDKFVVYNIISDLEEAQSGDAELIWVEDIETVAYQFPENGTTVKELAKVGYEFPGTEEDIW